MSARHHLAQVNIALPRAPLDSPALAEFVANLEPVNAFDDERLIINMSVWESIESLWGFVYGAGHLDVMRRRREWMTAIAESYMALWWVPAGSRADGERCARAARSPARARP